MGGMLSSPTPPPPRPEIIPPDYSKIQGRRRSEMRRRKGRTNTETNKKGGLLTAQRKNVSKEQLGG